MEFKEPQREIKTLQSVGKWTGSEAYKDLLGLILSINETAKSKSLIEPPFESSAAIMKVKELLDTVESWIDVYKPCEQPQRFGNKSFRDWHQRLLDDSAKLVEPLLAHDESIKGAVVELKVYLHHAFGNATRIDYGTGHEVNFLFFICCLYKLKVLVESDNLAFLNVVFKRYLEVTRKLQTVYRMEPAGSQGVWGLDDFQFLPFVWGSSQLVGHNSITPEQFVDETIIERYSSDYMFLECIRYINTVKTGPFAEHSNVLWGISSVPHWTKVNQGLIKMYKVEVLSKFPVIQHFVFGNLMPITPSQI